MQYIFFKYKLVCLAFETDGQILGYVGCSQLNESFIFINIEKLTFIQHANEFIVYETSREGRGTDRDVELAEVLNQQGRGTDRGVELTVGWNGQWVGTHRRVKLAEV